MSISRKLDILLGTSNVRNCPHFVCSYLLHFHSLQIEMNGKNCNLCPNCPNCRRPDTEATPFLDVQGGYVERPSPTPEVTNLLTFPVLDKEILKNMGDNGITSQVVRIRQLEWNIWLKPHYDLSKFFQCCQLLVIIFTNVRFF